MTTNLNIEVLKEKYAPFLLNEGDSRALVQVRTGSDSDFSKIESLFKNLNKKKINYSLRILSAHRTPHEMMEDASQLEQNGYKICVSAAGGSAHLAGMTASETPIPTIAIPVKSSVFGGLDSLLSMIQMPPGVPNGTVGIGQEKTAAEIASRVLLRGESEWREQKGIAVYSKDHEVDIQLSEKLGINTVNRHLSHPNMVSIRVLDLSNEKNYDASYLDDGHWQQIPIIIPVVKNKEFLLAKTGQELIDMYQAKGVYMATQVNDGSKPVDAKNALLFASQIMGLYNPLIKENFDNYRKNLTTEVIGKDNVLTSMQRA